MEKDQTKLNILIGHGAPFRDIWFLKYGGEKADSDFYLIFALVLLGLKTKERKLRIF